MPSIEHHCHQFESDEYSTNQPQSAVGAANGDFICYTQQGMVAHPLFLLSHTAAGESTNSTDQESPGGEEHIEEQQSAIRASKARTCEAEDHPTDSPKSRATVFAVSEHRSKQFGGRLIPCALSIVSRHRAQAGESDSDETQRSKQTRRERTASDHRGCDRRIPRSLRARVEPLDQADDSTSALEHQPLLSTLSAGVRAADEKVSPGISRTVHPTDEQIPSVHCSNEQRRTKTQVSDLRAGSLVQSDGDR